MAKSKSKSAGAAGATDGADRKKAWIDQLTSRGYTGAKQQSPIHFLKIEKPIDFEGLMDESQRLKREGNALYGSASYGDAIERYGEALEILKKIKGSEEEARKASIMKVFILQNLAACHHRLGIPEVAVSMCTDALELDTNNKQALERRAICYSEIGDYVSSYRDVYRLEELGFATGDITRLGMDIHGRHPEAVAAVEEERAREITGNLGGIKRLSVFARAYCIVHSTLLTAGWWFVAVFIVMAIFHASVFSPNVADATKEVHDRAGFMLMVLLVGGALDVFSCAMGWEGRQGAGDGVLSLMYRRGASIFVLQWVLSAHRQLIYGWALSLCVIAWTLCGFARYPLKMILALNPNSHNTVVTAMSALYLIFHPACLLAEYAAIWQASFLGGLKVGHQDALHAALLAYPVIGAWFYHRSLRVWSDSRKADKKLLKTFTAPPPRAAKPAVYQM